MLRPPAIPFDLHIARQKEGSYFVHKFGRDLGVESTYNTLWTPGTVYVYRDTAIVMKISSGSTDDVMTSGSGAWKIVITGLDANWEHQEEEVELNGRTAVNTTKLYLRVFRMKVIEAASQIAFNAGIVYAGTGTVTTGVPAVIHAEIDAGNNQSQMALMSIPANTVGYLKVLRITTAISKLSDARLLVRKTADGEPWQMKADPSFLANPVNDPYDYTFRFEAKSDIEIQAKAAAGGGDIGAHFSVLMEPDSNVRPTFL